MLSTNSKTNRSRVLAAATATLCMFAIGASALPASAATTGATTLTFTVKSGVIAITIPAGAVDSGSFTSEGTKVSGTLNVGAVAVADTRYTTNSGWVASAAVSDFTNAAKDKISATSMTGYKIAGLVVTGAGTGTVLATGSTASLSGTGAPVVEGKATNGAATAAWSASIGWDLPAATPPGDYSGTITHSIL